jgi:hypothetical protein
MFKLFLFVLLSCSISQGIYAADEHYSLVVTGISYHNTASFEDDTGKQHAWNAFPAGIGIEYDYNINDSSRWLYTFTAYRNSVYSHSIMSFVGYQYRLLPKMYGGGAAGMIFDIDGDLQGPGIIAVLGYELTDKLVVNLTALPDMSVAVLYLTLLL